jgi:hypothetical protein
MVSHELAAVLGQAVPKAGVPPRPASFVSTKAVPLFCAVVQVRRNPAHVASLPWNNLHADGVITLYTRKSCHAQTERSVGSH